MWPTIDGLRMLRGAEAHLVRGSVGMMVDHLVEEYRDDSEAWHYGIHAFDMWDVDQRIWLVEQVTLALLTRRRPPPPAAIWEATIDAIFCETLDLIEIEITDPTLNIHDRSWRQSVIDAYAFQWGRPPDVEAHEQRLSVWRAVMASVADVILSAASYQKAEAFRDSDFGRLEQFLIERGLPSDFLDRIPPIRTVGQTQSSIDRVQRIVFA